MNQSSIVILDNLVKVYGEAAYSYPTVARWAASFKVGESNLEDETRYWRPIMETIKVNIDLVESLIGKKILESLIHILMNKHLYPEGHLIELSKIN